MIPPLTIERWRIFWKAVGAIATDEEKAIDLLSDILGVYEKQFDALELAPPKTHMCNDCQLYYGCEMTPGPATVIVLECPNFSPESKQDGDES